MVDYSNPTDIAGNNYIVAEEEGMHQRGRQFEVLAGRTPADHTVRKVQEDPYRKDWHKHVPQGKVQDSSTPQQAAPESRVVYLLFAKTVDFGQGPSEFAKADFPE